MPSFKEYLENRKNSDTVDTTPISGSFQSYLIQRKAQEWNDSVNSIYKKMQGDFNQRSSGMGPLPSVGQYKSAISKDINNLLNNYSYAEEYANQIQDQKERQSYLNSIQKAKSSLDSFSREFQTGNPDVWNGSLTNALNKPSENHQIPEGNESLLSAEQLRAKIAEIESKRDEQLKKQEEKLKNSGLSGWMVNLFSSDEAKRNMADESDDSLKDELTKYKQQLYYAENEEKLNGLSHDLQQRVNAYLEKTAARKKFDELARDGVVLNDDEYLIRNGKRYTVKELQQMSDSLTDDDARLIVSELNSNGVDGQALLDYLKLKQGQDFIQEERKDAEQYAKDHPIASSIQSVFQTPLKLLGAVDAGMTAASNAITGQEAPIDYSKPVYSAARDQSTIRETVSSEIGNSVGQFLYQTGMSMGDFLTLMPLAAVPGGQAAVTAILGGSAATDTAMDVSSRGGTASQAFWSGLAAGAAEAAFEKFSLEAVLKAGKVTGIKSFIKELLKGAGVEGSEEVATEIANIISDQIIMGDKSNYSLAVKQYMDSGLSKPEAEKQATLDMVKQVGLAFAGGALSGGVIHGVQGGINWAGNYAEGKNTLHNGNIRDAIRLGFESDVDSPAYKTAVELSERLAKGEKISPSEVGAMVSDAQAQLTEKWNKAAVDSVQQVSNSAPDVSQKTNIGTQVQELRRSATQEVQNQRAEESTSLISPDNNTVKNGLARPLKAEATVSIGNETRQTTVNGIKRVTENGVEVQLEDGSVVPLEAVSFSNAEMEGLYADAAGYDTTTARAFVAGYDGSLPLSTYESAFDSIHEQAMQGADVDSAVEAAGVYGQMMSENARKLAYNTGRLQAGRQGGTIENNSVEAGGQHRGEKESVDVRQYQGASGGSDGRGRAGDGQRPRVSKEAGKADSRNQRTKIEVSNGIESGQVEFDSVAPEYYSNKQKRDFDIGTSYGYTVHYVPSGSVISFDGGSMTMDYVAFVFPGTKEIFALDGTNRDFIHHELFHQFLGRGTKVAKELLEHSRNRVMEDSDSFRQYNKLCEKQYGSNVTTDEIHEEITADLCEYAMSGSEEMRRRLEGLFEPGVLEKLAKQARDVFDANKTDGRSSETGENRYYLEGSESPSLRYYLDDVTSADADILAEENQRLKNQIETLRQEFKLTAGHKVKPAAVESLAEKILKDTGSGYNKETLVKNLQTLFDYIANDPEANFDEAMNVSVDIANSVLRQSSRLDTTLYDQYEDMRKYFRETALSLSEEAQTELENLYGGYEAFRKRNFGGMKLTKDGQSLDSLWEKISERWPELFPADTVPQEQPLLVADALRAVRPSYENPYGMDATESAYDLALQVYEGYFRLPDVHTFADKKKAELEQLRAKYENRLEHMRRSYKAREANLLQDQRQKRENVREAGKQRLAAQMERMKEQRQRAGARRQESALVRRYKPRIIRDALELGRWINHPTDAKHVPEPLRQAVAGFVNAIDFSSERLNRYGEPTMRTQAFKNLQTQLTEAQNKEGGKYSDEIRSMLETADPDLLPNLADLIDNASTFRLEEMTGEQLKELAHTVAAVKSMIRGANRLISDGIEARASDVAGGIGTDLSQMKDAKEYTGVAGMAKRLMNWDMLDAPSFFEELGKTAYEKLYKPLRKAFDKKIAHTKEAIDYMKPVLKGVDTETWSGDKAEKHIFHVSKGTLKLTTAQIMSLYELSKREQARGHILGGGIRPSDTVKGNQVDRSFRPVQLKPAELERIIDTLTPEQKRVADKIAAFFQTTSEWGNEVSAKLYGYRKFTEQNYFPIVSDRNYITTLQGDPNHQDATLKNLGMTKSTVKGANNPIMVEDIFDVFTRQVDQMSSYNAFVIPLNDMHKVLNYKITGSKGITGGSTREAMVRALGTDSMKYWNKLVEDINGMSRQEPPTLGDKLLSNMKAAAVGANIRVVIQQPTAYLRAAAMIDPKYLTKGLTMKSDTEQMNQYAPIAAWKDLGFFEMDTARGMRDILMGKEGLRDKAMKPAGWADTVTWGKLWNAVVAEMSDTRPDLKPGTEAFYEACGDRFSEIIDRTQVVDSVLHRSQIMRSKNYINKTVTSFMSEPTKSYNLLRSALRDVQKNGRSKAGKRLARAVAAYTASNIATALAAALVDAFRDDDPDKKWWEKYLSATGENALDNLNPLNMIPYLKDAVSVFSGYQLSRQEMAGVVDIINAGKQWEKFFKGESKYSLFWQIRNSAASISKLTGVPVSSALRDLEALVKGSTQALGEAGAPTERLEYLMDTAFYPVTKTNLSRYAGHIHRALQAGNTKLASDIQSELEKNGVDEDQIATAMRKRLKEEEPRVAEGGKAKMDGDLTGYRDLVMDMKADGYVQDWVVGAINGWITQVATAGKAKLDGDTSKYNETVKALQSSGISESEISEAVDGWLVENKQSQAETEKDEKEDESQEESVYEASDAIEAVESGNMAQAKEVIADLESYLKEGQTLKEKKQSIRSQFTKHYKPLYIEMFQAGDKAGMAEIRRTLMELDLGYANADFTQWIKQWRKEESTTK